MCRKGFSSTLGRRRLLRGSVRVPASQIPKRYQFIPPFSGVWRALKMRVGM